MTNLLATRSKVSFMDRPIDNLENGMLLYSEKDESDYTYDDYLADEADRR